MVVWRRFCLRTTVRMVRNRCITLLASCAAKIGNNCKLPPSVWNYIFFSYSFIVKFFTLQIESQKYCQGFLLDNICFCHLTFIVKFLTFYRVDFVSQVFHKLFHKLKSFPQLFTSFPQLYTFVKLHKKQSKFLCNIPTWNIL